jgi:hypothetical protein
MWFTFDPRNPINQIAVPVARVKQIIELNRKGEKAEFLAENNHIPSAMPDFISSAGEDSITRFDRSKKRHDRSRNGQGHAKEERKKPQQAAGQGQNPRQEQFAKSSKNNEKRHKRRRHPHNNKTNPAKNEKQQ